MNAAHRRLADHPANCRGHILTAAAIIIPTLLTLIAAAVQRSLLTNAPDKPSPLPNSENLSLAAGGMLA
jgi:hypothetical protein